MLSADFVLKLVRDLEDVRLFGELYFEIARKRLTSDEDIEDAKIKMKFCKEKVVVIANALDQQLKDFQSSPVSVGSVVDALRQLGEQTRLLENAAMKRMALKSKLNALFDDYQKGKYSFFEYTEMKMRLLQGRTQEQWEMLLDGLVTSSLTKIKPLNKLVFDSMYKENRFNNLRIESAPVQIPERPVAPAAPLPPLIVPRPAEKIDYARSQAADTKPMAAAEMQRKTSAFTLPAPPAPDYHKESEHISKLHDALSARFGHGKTEVKAGDQEIQGISSGTDAVQKIETSVAKNIETIDMQPAKTQLPKEELSMELAPLTDSDLGEPLPGRLAEPLESDDPYVKWLNESDSEKEEDRIDRLINELKSQPIEAESKSKVMEELKTQLDKLKQKKEDVKPLDPGMLEEGHEEYDF